MQKRELLRDILLCIEDDNPLELIRFMMAPIIQDMDSPIYTRIVNAISDDYSMQYHRDDTGYSFGSIHISTSGYTRFDIIFTYRLSLLGYCRCEPDDPDYRPDKGCCGHRCDWNVPMIRIFRNEEIVYSYMWKGDESSFWDFEDKWEIFVSSIL